jgi:hypothetical protein
MNADSPMRNFDPAKIAYYEKENYVAYYQKDWLKLLRVSVGMVKETFGLSLWQAIYAAYLVACAEIAAAPFPNNDIPRAEAHMRRFYALIKRIHQADFDIDEVARLEVNWWVVHRRLFGKSDNPELIDALSDLYAATFRVPKERVRDAAHHRALGVLYSDQWVNAGKPAKSRLLQQEEEELRIGYVALCDALSPAR